jgi:hypothetical protein
LPSAFHHYHLSGTNIYAKNAVDENKDTKE